MKPQLLLLTIILAFVAFQARGEDPTPPPEPENFHWGVVRAWDSGSHAPAGEKNSAGLGHVLIVEVKDFNGWVIHCADLFGAVDQSYYRELDAGVQRIVQARLLKRCAHASRVLRTAAESKLKEELKGYQDELVIGEKDIPGITKLIETAAQKAQSLPRYTVLSPNELVGDVLALPSFEVLASVLPNTPAERVKVMGDTDRVIERLMKSSQRLRLKINDIVIDDIAPENWDSAKNQSRPKAEDKSNSDYFWFRFPLVETEKNAAAWLHFRRNIFMSAPVELTLTHPFGEREIALQSIVTSRSNGTTPSSRFHLVMIRDWQMWLAIGLLVICLSLFLVSTLRTDLLRDIESPPRADGVLPYSLARSQMAFWFILVIASFLFLWISLGKVHVLNDTCLWLIGIGAGTALGAAMIGKPKDSKDQIRNRFLTRLRGENREAFIQRLESAKAEDLKDSTTPPAPSDPTGVISPAQVLTTQKEELKTQKGSSFRRLLDDWLTDGSNYSFHRYQMLTWTIILGAVFVVTVVRDRALPVFDTVMLGLLGISNGTYLGFRLASKQN